MSLRPSLGVSVLYLTLAVPALAHAQPSTTPFLRGDADADAAVNITDAVFILNGLFLDGSPPECLDAADVDNDAVVGLTDAVYLLNFLFLEGPPPVFPFPDCGVDPAGVPGCFLHPPCATAGPAVTFFGVDLPTDLIVFVVDRSGSLVNEGELDVSREEVASTIESLRPGMQLGVTFFDRDAKSFPEDETPLVVSAPLIAAAAAWTRGVPSGSGTCPLEGLRAALRFAERATVGRKTIVYVSDGGGTCSGATNEETHAEVLDRIVDENVEEVPVHVFSLNSAGGIFDEYLRALAQVTGGRYTVVPF